MDHNLHRVKAWMWGTGETVGRVEGQYGGDGDTDGVWVVEREWRSG